MLSLQIPHVSSNRQVIDRRAQLKLLKYASESLGKAAIFMSEKTYLIEICHRRKNDCWTMAYLFIFPTLILFIHFPKEMAFSRSQR
jgi:hypothetical protein